MADYNDETLATLQNLAGSGGQTTVNNQGFESLYQTYGKMYGIDPNLLRAVAQTESGENPTIQGKTPIKGGPDNGKFALGLMQLSPSNVARLGIKDWRDPSENIAGGAQVLSEALQNSKGNYQQALNNYSGGGGADYWGKVFDHYASLGGDPYSLPGGLVHGQEEAQGLDDLTLTHLKSIANNEPLAPGQTFGQGAPPADIGSWSTTNAALNAATMGQLPKLTAAAAAVGHFATHPGDIGGAQDAYTNTLMSVNKDREAWENQYPGVNMGAQLTAGTAAQGGVISAGEEALGLLGQGVKNLLPETARVLAPVGRFLMGTAGEGATGFGGLMARAGSRAAAGARQGVEAGLMDKATGEGMGSSSPTQNALAGAAVNTFVAPLLGNLAPSLKADVDPGVAAAGKTLVDAGVDIKGSQLVKNPALALPGKVSANQLDQYTGAIAKTIDPASPDGQKLTPDFIDRQYDRIGGQLGQAAQATGGITMNLPAFDKFSNIADAASKNPLLTPEDANKVAKLVDRITDLATTNGKISGEQYKDLTQRNGLISLLARDRNPILAGYGRDLSEAINTELANSVNAAGPQQAAAKANFELARQQYKRLIASEPAADVNTGVINPKQLASSVESKYSQYGNTPHGQDPYLDLVHGAGLLPAPTAAGGVKQPSSLLGRLGKYAGLAGGALVGEAALQHGSEIISHIAENPALMGNAILGGLGAGGLATHKAIRSAVGNSAGYRNLLINRGLGSNQLPVGLGVRALQMHPNMLVPAGVMIQGDQGQ